MSNAHPTPKPFPPRPRRLSAALPAAATATLAIIAAAPAQASALQDLSDAVADGTGSFSFRYRYERVDQDGFDRDADASTLRSRFTWASAELDAFSFGFEADYVAVIGPEDYDSTVNGKNEYPIVADPKGFDLNRAFVRYRSGPTTVTGGRQRILHGNQRFVGNVGWRQNEQTYDAARIELTPAEGLTVDYAYVANVNRVFGPEDGTQPADWQSDTHLFTARYEGVPGITVDGYGYLMDFENDNGPANSNATFGLSITGDLGPATVNAGYATQSDYADSPLDYRADYFTVGATVPLGDVTLKAGYEVLGSDGGAAGFRTPLATLHRFQGWADQFVVTPDDGVQDGYAGITAAIGAFTVNAVYHHFSADRGGADYGTEIDLALTWSLSAKADLQLKFADFDADDFAGDTSKAWLTIDLAL